MLNKAYPKRNGWKKKKSRLGASCDVFVGTVVTSIGYDSFPHGLNGQYDILQKSSKWIRVKWHGKRSELKSGDVLYAKHRGNDRISSGHIYIYVVKDGTPYIAEASAGSYYPVLHKYYSRYNTKRDKYVNVYRAKDESVR